LKKKDTQKDWKRALTKTREVGYRVTPDMQAPLLLENVGPISAHTAEKKAGKVTNRVSKWTEKSWKRRWEKREEQTLF